VFHTDFALAEALALQQMVEHQELAHQHFLPGVLQHHQDIFQVELITLQVVVVVVLAVQVVLEAVALVELTLEKVQQGFLIQAVEAARNLVQEQPRLEVLELLFFDTPMENLT
jgi:hypothetical protein